MYNVKIELEGGGRIINCQSCKVIDNVLYLSNGDDDYIIYNFDKIVCFSVRNLEEKED